MNGNCMEPVRTVGLLGGGQLARMLAEAAIRLGLRPIVLTPKATDPAAQRVSLLDAGQWIAGDWDQPEELRRFLSQVQVATYENEFVPTHALEEALRGIPVRFIPAPATIYALQDKLRQKRVLEELSIPSAPFLEFGPDQESLAQWLDQVSTRFPQGFVLKWAQLGYDGKGTWILPEKASSSSKEDAIRFCEQALARKVPLYAEAKVRFKRELAVVAAYSTQGAFAPFPLVISEQEKGVCKRVLGPATEFGVSPELERLAHQHAHALAARLGLFGTFAIEFFETDRGDLWVNELAPRVHNTGHYSQLACSISQFEAHWRGVLGLDLPEPSCVAAFAMLNLLGPEGASGKVQPPAPPSLEDGFDLYWYGKEEIRSGRKMGHLNAAADSPEKLQRILKRMQDWEAEWARQARGNPR